MNISLMSLFLNILFFTDSSGQLFVVRTEHRMIGNPHLNVHELGVSYRSMFRSCSCSVPCGRHCVGYLFIHWLSLCSVSGLSLFQVSSEYLQMFLGISVSQIPVSYPKPDQYVMIHHDMSPSLGMYVHLPRSMSP